MANILRLELTHPHIREFTNANHEVTGHSTYDFDPIHSVVMAGARYDQGAGLSWNDQLYLQRFFVGCDKRKIPIAYDACIMPLNIKNGHDVLDPKLSLPARADALLVCLIPDIDKSREYIVEQMSIQSGWPRERTVKKFEEMRAMNSTDLTVSPYHSPTAWYEMAERTGIRVIMAASVKFDVDASNFSRSHYKTGASESLKILNGRQAKAEFLFREDVVAQLPHLKSAAHAL